MWVIVARGLFVRITPYYFINSRKNKKTKAYSTFTFNCPTLVAQSVLFCLSLGQVCMARLVFVADFSSCGATGCLTKKERTKPVADSLPPLQL